VVEAVRHAGFPEQIALGEFETVRDDVLRNFPKACEIVAASGFSAEVEKLFVPMEQGLKARANFSYTGQGRVYLDERDVGARVRK
jgi:hypothetical protein